MLYITTVCTYSLVPRSAFFVGQWKSEGPGINCMHAPALQLKGFAILLGTSVTQIVINITSS